MAEILATSGLTSADFPAFVRAVHGHDPFPWQAALAAEVLTTGLWPDLVDVPTGLGKTFLIDIAVFAAAATVHQSGQDRLGRRRCFFVVDRRLVVDQAFEHARLIAEALADAERDGDTGVVGRVAAGLRAYAPHAARDALLPVTRMRGGVTWSAAWLDRPDRPGVVLGTVDQVGSRLLFRGYGVSDRRRPIDAALTGTDALLLIDEAHLSSALLSTLAAAQQRDRSALPLPGLSVVRLSATDAGATRPFVLDPDAHRGNEEAWRRLTAGKALTTQESTVKDCARLLADTARRQLTTLAGMHRPGGPAPAVLVVCNTVDRARAVHDLLRKHLSGPKAAVEADCDLLIGRSRPIDRPDLQQAILKRFGVDRADDGRRPAVLVATQTVEVGVNLDVDALVTESASWDALVQRLGRLNRLGRFPLRFPGAGPAAAVVVHDGQDNGPVYAAARDATWQALREQAAQTSDGALDVSPLACRKLTEGPLNARSLRCAPADVPVLLSPTLDAWVQTAPVPLLDPPIEPFLHGFNAGAASVQVMWRDGLVSGDLLDDPFSDDGAEVRADSAATMLAHIPPRTAEIVEMPWHAVRQWMRGQAVDPVSDLETEPDTDRPRVTRTVQQPFRVLARRPDTRAVRTAPGRNDRDAGAEMRWQWIGDDELRPADLIIVPVQRGGLDRYGWAPSSTTQVRDVAETATFLASRSRRGGILRLDSALVRRLDLPDGSHEPVQQLITELRSDENARAGDRLQHIGRQLAAALPDQPPPSAGWPTTAWQRLRTWASSGRLRVVELTDSANGWTVDGAEPQASGMLLTGPIPDPAAPHPQAQPDRDDEEAAASSVSGGPVTLAVHHSAVRRRCSQIAAALGLPAPLRAVLADAAGWHDLGKVEERFQIMLHNADPCEAALAAEPLAKSGLDPDDRLAWRRAARLSGLPAGARHEAWSAALVAEYLRQTGHYEGDHDLLVHLVAAHHGYARPLARLVSDPAPRPVTAIVGDAKVTVPSQDTVDLDQPARFAKLNDRYGRWGLALLEAIVRCADMTVSEEGS